MTFWAISALINSLTSFTLGIFVFFRNRKSEKNITYGLCCLSLFIWSSAYFFWQISETASDALFWSKTLMAGAVFIPIVYLHHIYVLLGKLKSKKMQLFYSYIFGLLSALLCFSKYFIKGVGPKLIFKFWPIAGHLFFPFLVI